MATSDDSGGEGKVWDGYSDYATVSSRIGRNVFNAIDAYADVHSLHVEGARVKPREAATARAEILSAAMSLKPELENQKETNEAIETILDRWDGGSGDDDVPVEVPDEGFLRAFDDVQLSVNDPSWLYQLVIDIRRAGWELGYLKAGRHEDAGPRELEPRDVNELLES